MWRGEVLSLLRVPPVGRRIVHHHCRSDHKLIRPLPGRNSKTTKRPHKVTQIGIYVQGGSKK